MKKIFILWLFLLSGIALHAQYSPSFKRTITITNDGTTSYTNYQVYLKLNTAALVAGGFMQADGDDIRFSPDSSCSPTVFYDYFIENYMNTDSTMIWIKIPVFNSGATYTFQMYYGDPVAATASNFAATFPSAFISSSSLTLTGNLTYDWFELDLGDTLYIPAGDSTLQINARNILIRGNVNGEGRGFQISGSMNMAGIGQGAGTPSSANNSGAGGAGYGASGGIGCSDAGDAPGTGGASYGTLSGTDIQMGSSGANSDNTTGGAGGGKIVLNAEVVQITGFITLNGNSAQLPGGSRGGGGGAGGGLKVECSELRSSGTMTANGGQGSDGTSAANDGGGGGAGGRIKLFYETNPVLSSTISVTGGPAGIFGGVPGGPGGAGTIYSGVMTYAGVITLGGQNSLGASSGSLTASACDNYTSPSGSQVWTSSGTYFDTIPNAIGCDSIITVQLTINNASSASLTANACGNYTSPSGNQVWTSSGTYFDTIPNAIGCDSIITVQLTINNASSASLTASGCGNYTSPSGNQVWTSSGTYFDTIPNAAGCDSIITVQLTIISSVDTSVTLNGVVLNANASGVGYQWIDCGNGNTPVGGETNQSFTPTVNGSYAVVVTQGTCSDTSSCYNVIVVGITQSAAFASDITVFPNPTNGHLTINMGHLYDNINIVVTNSIGQTVLTKNVNNSSVIELELLQTAGIYLLTLDTGKGVRKTVKIQIKG